MSCSSSGVGHFCGTLLESGEFLWALRFLWGADSVFGRSGWYGLSRYCPSSQVRADRRRSRRARGQSLGRQLRQSSRLGFCAARLPSFQPLRAGHPADQQAICRQRELLAGVSRQDGFSAGHPRAILRTTDIICQRCAILIALWSGWRGCRLLPRSPCSTAIIDWCTTGGSTIGMSISAGRVRRRRRMNCEDAIRAAAAGKSVTPSEVRGVGCYISDLD